jgi:hypothetical protein
MSTENKRPVPKGRGMRELTDEILDGFSVEDMKCRSCSGYGNCGYKSYFVNPAGGVLSICMQQRRQLQCKRDGIPFDPSDI